MLSSILVAVDGSAHANAAVDFASDLAAKFGAQLVIANIVTRAGSDRVPEELLLFEKIEQLRVTERDIIQGAATEIVANAAKRARSRGAAKVVTVTPSGDPAQTIVALAKKRKVDLIALGRRGLGDLKSLLLGSVSHKVSQLADCACLTVKK